MMNPRIQNPLAERPTFSMPRMGTPSSSWFTLSRLLELYLPGLIITAFLARPLYYGWIGLGILLALLCTFKERRFQGGDLTIPLFLYALPTVISTYYESPEIVGKALVQATFPFLYLLHPYLPLDRHRVERLWKLLIAGGWVILPVVLYHTLGKDIETPHYGAGIWGGVFRTGILYGLVSIASLFLYFQRRHWFYLLTPSVFFFVILILGRRSVLLGILCCGFSLLYLFRSRISWKGVILIPLVLGAILGMVWVTKLGDDQRFKLVKEYLFEKKKVDEHFWDTISSGRIRYFLAGLRLARSDWEHEQLFPVVFGHGVYAVKKYNPELARLPFYYESTFFLSEYLARGFMGLFGILWIFTMALYRFRQYASRSSPDLYEVFFVLPLLFHLGFVLFNVFWHIDLPLFLLCFGCFERIVKGAPLPAETKPRNLVPVS